MSPQGPMPQRGLPQPQGMGGPPQGGPPGPAPSQPASLMQQGGVGPFSKANPRAAMPGNAPGYQGPGPNGPGAPPGFGGSPLGPMEIAGRMQNIPKQTIFGPGQQGPFGGAPGV